MRLSPGFVVPSAVAALSTILLVGPAASQIPTGSAATLPAVTVDAPKQATKPHRAERVTNTGGARRSSSTAQTSSSAAPASEAPLARAARLERAASSCNGGCETSFKTPNAPWVGCSGSGGGAANAPFSPTCRDTLTYKSYEDCVETKVFLGDYRNRAYWICSSLAAGGKFKVADLKRATRR